jgi:hypothetical protein
MTESTHEEKIVEADTHEIKGPHKTAIKKGLKSIREKSRSKRIEKQQKSVSDL